MTFITEYRLTQDLETFPNDGSLVAANKLAERDEDHYIQSVVLVTQDYTDTSYSYCCN